MVLKILHSESSLAWGGQENRTLNEMIGLRELGHSVGVIGQPNAGIVGRAKELGFPYFEIPMRGALDFPAIARIRNALRNFDADILNTHSSKDTQLAGIAARLLFPRRPKVVRTRHLAIPITSRITYSGIPDHVVCVSHFVANYLISQGVPEKRVTAVRTGINFENYRIEGDRGFLRRELGIPEASLLVGTIAILRFKKGHADLLAAIPKVLESVDAHFVFAGNGPMYETIQEQVTAMGLQNRVHLLGLRRDVVDILRSIDLFVLPTHQEALGTAFVEAGAMGRPAIGTRVDGVPEVIVDGQTGILVPPHDSAALAAAILVMAASQETRQKMGSAACAHVRELFSRDAMAQGMVSVYSTLLEQR